MSVVLMGIIIIVVVFVAMALLVVMLGKWSLGTLAGTSIYADTESSPGEVLYSDRLQLKGKPDYIMKDGDHVYPVEVKTGKTPAAPYPGHIMQLMAYCALIEDTYHSVPEYGVIKYPEKEYRIDYTEQQKTALKQMLEELKKVKESGIEPTCTHPYH